MINIIFQYYNNIKISTLMISNQSLNFKPKTFFFSLNFTLFNSILQQKIGASSTFRMQVWKGIQKCDSSKLCIFLVQNQLIFKCELAFNVANYDEKRDIQVNVILYQTRNFKETIIGQVNITTSKYIRQYCMTNSKYFPQKVSFGEYSNARLIVFLDTTKQMLIKNIKSYQEEYLSLPFDSFGGQIKKKKLQTQSTPLKKINYNKQFLINFRCDSLKTITEQQSCFQTELKLKSIQSSELISSEDKKNKCRLNRALTMLKIFDEEFGEDFKQHNSESNHSIDSMFDIEMQKQKQQQKSKHKQKRFEQDSKSQKLTNIFSNPFSKQVSQVQTKPQSNNSLQIQDEENQNLDSSSLNNSLSWLLVPQPEIKQYKTKYYLLFLLIIFIGLIITNLEPVSKHLLSKHKVSKKTKKNNKKRVHQQKHHL